MSDFEVLCYNNYPLKYHHYCKYHNIHLVGYNSAVKLKSQAKHMVNLHHMWLLVQKPAMSVHKLKFVLLLQLITILNNYPWLTCLLFQSTFCQPSKFTTDGMVSVKGSNMKVDTWYSSTQRWRKVVKLGGANWQRRKYFNDKK